MVEPGFGPCRLAPGRGLMTMPLPDMLGPGRSDRLWEFPASGKPGVGGRVSSPSLNNVRVTSPDELELP